MIKGIFPPIITPFMNDEIAIDKLKRNITLWNKIDLSGYVVMGSNGESVFLTRKEKLILVENVKEYASDGKSIIAGTGLDSVKETISLSNDAAKAGADFVLILTPSFYHSQMKHKELLDYFTRIADNVNVPVIIYNVPKFTNVNISADTVAALAFHKNIVGLKSSSENIAELTEFISVVPRDFSVLAGTASVLYPGLIAGAVGGVLALANVCPEECVILYKYFLDGNFEQCLSFQKRLIKPNKAVTAAFGVPGLKAIMDIKGYYGGPVRSPLQNLTESEINLIRKIFQNADLL